MEKQPQEGVRVNRAQEAREAQTRPAMWRPASALPEPHERDGLHHRWIRKSMMGMEDHRNMSTARREGWVPCILKDYPEIANDFAAFGTSPDDIIEMGGLVLCKTTAETVQQRRDYYSDQTRRETEAVNNSYLREQDRRMPMFNESSSRVAKFGRNS
jgi:hypothetical protein